MKITTIDDIRTAIQNSGLNEHFEILDRDEFVQFCWDNMDGMELELDDMFNEFLESKGLTSEDGVLMYNITMEGIISAMLALGDHSTCSETCSETCPFHDEKSRACPMRKITNHADKIDKDVKSKHSEELYK